ncbi:MAG: D-sedoheptulose 7-phosphate isomerase [Kosmotogales bacterium]|nr:D-sedoheptulose 7-phosphate isomerase [Kosmotogales bacterium]
MEYLNIVKNNFINTSKIELKLLENYKNAIVETSFLIANRIKGGGGVYFMGNGGSAADSLHLSAELMGRFYINRSPIKSMALNTNPSLLTEIPNDFTYEELFERQIEALLNEKDVIFGISTSGNSKNIVRGLMKAKEKKTFTIGLTGNTGGKMEEHCDVCFKVPSTVIPRIQESHIILGHTICEIVENILFGKNNR